MSKYVLLTASEHNGGVIPIGMGRWLSTTWKIYSDGSYEKAEEFDEMKFCFEGQPQPRHISTTRGSIGEPLMTNLKECLSSHSSFPKRGLGCDMNWWKISIFDSNQQILDSYRGVVSPRETDRTLKIICEVLPDQRSATL